MPATKSPVPERPAAENSGGSPSPRIALFAPIEPLQSGVATYTTKILKGLLKKRPDLSIDVYIDDGYQPMDFGPGRLRFINHREFPGSRASYAAVLYQTGNNFEFHGYMFPYLYAYGGIVELHDVKLSGIYSQISHRLMEHAKALHLLQVVKMIVMYPELRYFLWYKFLKPWCSKDYYLDRHLYRKSFMVRRADMIIVRDEHPVNYFRLPARKCRVITHGIDIKELPGEERKAAIRRRFNMDAKAFVLVSAGIINSIKKIDRVIEAVARVRDKIPGLLYVLAGQSIRGDNYIESLIGRLGVGDIVRITGWLSNEDWLDYIAVADAGINLRSENLGEHSGPTANFFERGKVMLISDFEQNRIYPDDFAIKIPNIDDDVAIIAEKILWLYNNRDYRIRGGALARRFAEERLDFDEIIIARYCAVMGV